MLAMNLLLGLCQVGLVWFCWSSCWSVLLCSLLLIHSSLFSTRAMVKRLRSLILPLRTCQPLIPDGTSLLLQPIVSILLFVIWVVLL
jgi:hypothetical protein